jgi:hypothetical protein
MEDHRRHAPGEFCRCGHHVCPTYRPCLWVCVLKANGDLEGLYGSDSKKAIRDRSDAALVGERGFNSVFAKVLEYLTQFEQLFKTSMRTLGGYIQKPARFVSWWTRRCANASNDFEDAVMSLVGRRQYRGRGATEG